MTVEAGQFFIECGVPLEHRDRRRVKVNAVFPYGYEQVPAGTAVVSTVLDTADGPREVRLRMIGLGELHTDPVNRYGAPRRSGYLLETAYPTWWPLIGRGDVEHAIRPVPSDSFKDMAEAACMPGRWRKPGLKPIQPELPHCPKCVAVLEAFLNEVPTR